MTKAISPQILLFTLTIFLSASLLFFVQPMFAKMVLPILGGSPAVWTTAMLFFQTVLIGGYTYAHLLTRHVPLRGQAAVHLSLCLLALLFLPVAANTDVVLDPHGSIALQTLWLFALGVGVPFAVLSANAPLLQDWYRRSGGPSADDPYFLYGASNLGSLLALLAFPLVAEPLFGARAIANGWALGFVALTALLTLCGFAWKRGLPGGPDHDTPRAKRPAPGQIGWWLLLAMIPSSMMLAVTATVSTEIGSFPLVWVIPLTLYLLSFVLTFTSRPLLSTTRLATLFLFAFIAMVMITAAGVTSRLGWPAFAILVVGFFLTALLAHRRLYERRPAAEGLTFFYVTMSVGGALGGLFNSLVAPALFRDVHEGPIIIALAGVLLIGTSRGHNMGRDIGSGIVVGLLAAAPVLVLMAMGTTSFPTSVLALSGLLVFVGFYKLQARPAGLMPAAAVTLLAGAIAFDQPAIHRDRSFFGTHKVTEGGGLRLYRNGTTVHGTQRLDQLGQRPTPMAYYHPNGPLGQVMQSDLFGRAQTVGIVGLGVGALACYATQDQDWHFYEIDEAVDRIARDPALFDFMTECAPDAPTHLGDARLVLERQDIGFDILVADAYSSDALPLHLMTREAMEIYRARLNPGGILAIHISNRFYRLEQPVGRLAQDLGLQVLIQVHAETPERPFALGEVPMAVALLAEPETDLSAFRADPRWTDLTVRPGPVWTDDHADLISLLLEQRNR